MADLAELEQKISDEIAAADGLTALDNIRINALGKKGEISLLLKTLGKMQPDERKTFGAAVNQLKGRVNQVLAARKTVLEDEELDRRLATETMDVTLPVQADPANQGRLHPLSQVWEEVVAIFADMGFAVADGPHIETDFYNFTALNIPPEHPARQEHDTFYFAPDENGDRKVLRTQTSNVQIRTMQTQEPPIRIIAPGRTYRNDSDLTHTPQFHQVEALVIDKTTTLAHLKGTLEEFFKAFFEIDNLKMRFRASHFPFTEVSYEVDIGYTRKGNQIIIGDGDEWLEILGSGMVHPNVLRNCDLDPDVYQGFAFGMGIDRIAMLKYGIPDLRAFFDADLRWIDHYGFAPFDIPSLTGGLSR
ncbi:MAG: phenylalanine--tRNA ligase subunit alpha [Alphaproteobacteria bacterium]|nr:phenylalanine--tRNA ligase subunit alpha [Alphaproteobacteria bacterium]